MMVARRWKFYSSVILNGTETLVNSRLVDVPFYSSVILNGTETTQLVALRR